MDATSFDIRIIPEFDGRQPVLEWLENIELICRLKSVTELENVIPLRLAGGSFNVYQQLSAENKRDADSIKAALRTAFAVDKFTAYDQVVLGGLETEDSLFESHGTLYLCCFSFSKNIGSGPKFGVDGLQYYVFTVGTGTKN